MVTKSIIQEKVLKLENDLEVFKNEYPRNMADCWRKQTPPLIVALVIILSLGLLAFSFLGAVMFVCVLPVIFVIAVKSWSTNKYKKIGAEPKVLNSLRELRMVSNNQPDVVEFTNKASDSINKIANYKNEIEKKSKIQFVIIVIIAMILSSFSFFYNMLNERGINENFIYLDMKIGSTFTATKHHCSKGIIANDNYTFRIEDHDGDPYFRFVALDLDVKGTNENDILILKFVDKDGYKLPYFPEFIINASDANASKEVYSSSQRDMKGEESDNYIILKTIKEGNIFFTIDRMMLQ